MEQKRFSSKVGEDYNLFSSVCHHDELQEAIGKALKEHFFDSSLSKIEVLEIGSGSGHTSVKVLLAEPRAVLTAVDNEPIMIKQAKNFLKDFIFQGRIEFVESDALEYLKTVKDETFDAFVSAWLLHNFKSNYRKKVLKEIYRVLKKGGFFVNGDNYAFDEEHLEKKELDWQLKKLEKFVSMGKPGLKKEWTKHYLEDKKPDVIMKEGKSIDLMKKIGFCNVKKIYRKHREAVVTAIR